ncbi:hypothetical protein B0H19DRAFT_1129583 [Mycena capillaripes]|nr:hypothetical protein B0H19DRAFT_1129583 [Mycena capillaripes]
MHPALAIPEILDLIISEVDPLAGMRPGSKALAALAGTSTIFRDMALDALWQHQTNILNLIRCMPSELWVESVDISGARSLTRRRRLVASDWDRVLTYAYRIKSLVCLDSAIDPHLSTVYDDLRQHAPRRYILPNLEHLTWRHRNPPYSPYTTLFLGPRITTIRVGAQSDHRFPVPAMLGQKYPNLVSVAFEGMNAGSSDSEQRLLCTFIKGLARVEYLEVQIIDSEALMHLGRLPTLVVLHATLPPSISFPGGRAGKWFTHLRATELWIERGEISALVAFVQTWTKPELKSFVAWVDFCRELNVVDLYQALATHCVHQHLEKLKVRIYQKDHAFIVPNPGHYFSPLRMFSHLRSVDIRVSGGYDMDDERISEMACSWPYLEELRLGSYLSGHPPRCTLLSLCFLAQHCPCLTTIELTLDALTAPRLLTDPSAQSVLHDQLVSFNAAFSPISDASSVVTFLSSIFLNLTQIYCALDGYSDRALGTEYHRRWKNVERRVRNCRG